MFKERSHKKELLDANDIPEKDLFRNLKELDVINNYLGGYQVTFSALDQILKPNKSYTLVDIGSGGGDTLKRINSWSKNKSLKLDLFGVDIKPVCIHYSEQHQEDSEISFVCDDYKNMFNHVAVIDIIHASLFCHHLSEEQIVELIKFSYDKGATLLINDLERHPLAYYAIKFLTALFSRSYLVKNDAPLSVLRGFKKKEWQTMIKKSGVPYYSVANKWAFRHQIIIYGNKRDI
jgi:2-polyprenyl-3-methyl-5-hydroxy-6-metoxy-1,4-benzoquinol methylase